MAGLAVIVTTLLPILRRLAGSTLIPSLEVVMVMPSLVEFSAFASCDMDGKDIRVPKSTSARLATGNKMVEKIRLVLKQNVCFDTFDLLFGILLVFI